MAKAPKKKSFFPSVLSFEKKIIPSIGYFYSTTWENRYESRKPVEVVEKGVKGVVSVRKTQKYNTANLQIIDTSYLANNHDTLSLEFSVKFSSGFNIPAACNSPEFEEVYKNIANNYVKKYGFKELAKRYALNIANARFLHRNRLLAETIEVNVYFDKQNIIFNAFDYSLKTFEKTDENIEILAEKIADALSGKTDMFLIKINCFAKMGFGQEVFPSQELILDKGKGEKSKTLSSINGQATYHAQKIGNAIRTIDNWYLGSEKDPSAIIIPIEIYGTHTTSQQAFREPSTKLDFYTLLDKYIETSTLDNDEQEHYVIANLIRGGVFGVAGGE